MIVIGKRARRIVPILLFCSVTLHAQDRMPPISAENLDAEQAAAVGGSAWLRTAGTMGATAAQPGGPEPDSGHGGLLAL